MKNAITSAQKELENRSLPNVLLMNNGDVVTEKTGHKEKRN